LRQVQGRLLPGGEAVAGYEIHAGVSTGAALDHPLLDLSGRPDGVRDPGGQILATYVHGLFDAPDAQAALLRWAGLDAVPSVDLNGLREASLDRLADAVAQHLEDNAWRRALG
jgi:adenosylcobyric acid synthase